MAARFRKIVSRVFTDEKFRQLSNVERLIGLYLLIAQSNRIGLFSFSHGKACEDLGMSPRMFNKGFLRVCQTLNWEWDAEARVCYLPTWWRYNQPESVNNLVGNLKDLNDLPATPLIGRFAANTVHLSDATKQSFEQALAKGYPHPSYNPSPQPSPTQKQKQEQEQEQEQEMPLAVEIQFMEFWSLYPTRNGKKLGQPETLRKWERLNAEDKKLVLDALQHYASSEMVVKGIGIKDPHRWLRNGKDDEPWRDWIEPESKPAGKELRDGKVTLPRTGFADLDYQKGVF